MGTWTTTTLAGKSADLFEPDRWHDPRAAVLFLHGHGRITLRDNPVYTALLDEHGLGAICPHGQRSWWGSRVCAEFDPELPPQTFVRDVVLAEMARRWDVRPPGVGLLGVSMGGQGALKLAYRWPAEFPVVVALAPAVDFHIWHGRGLPLDEMYDSAETARQDTATLLLHPLNWPRHQFLLCDPTDVEWFDGVERLASKLSSTGIPFDSEFTLRKGGHSWEYFNFVAPRVMCYLRERLTQEHRRLPVT